MDLRVVVVTPDQHLGELVRAQVDNTGCHANRVASFDDALGVLGWADAAVVDVAGEGIEDLNRLRVEVPLMRVLAIAPDEELAESARSAGAQVVLVEPFSVADLAAAVRAMGRSGEGEAEVVDLRTGERTAAPAVDDAPWWATR